MSFEVRIQCNEILKSEQVYTFLTPTGFDAFYEEGYDACFYYYDIDKRTLENKLINIPFHFQLNELSNDINWNKEWESNAQPVLIANNALIHNKPIPLNSAKYQIMIVPEGSFGTGHHETTQSIIETIHSLDITDCTVCDVGAGTGILGILTSLMGAAHVNFVENDPTAIKALKNNLTLNLIGPYSITIDINSITSTEKYHVIIANIHYSFIKEHVHFFLSHAHDHCQLIFSGFHNVHASELIKLFETNHCHLLNHHINNNWSCLQFQYII
jgi:ribosomal protein L11 methyltransferase